MLTELLRPSAAALLGGDVLGEVTNSPDFLVGVFEPEPRVLLFPLLLLVGVCVPLPN